MSLEVIIRLPLESVPRREQCSAYTTRAWIDVSRLARFCLHSEVVSFSRCESQGGSPQTFALATLEAFGVGISARSDRFLACRKLELRNCVIVLFIINRKRELKQKTDFCLLSIDKTRAKQKTYI